jgi:hypothetical protein
LCARPTQAEKCRPRAVLPEQFLPEQFLADF